MKYIQTIFSALLISLIANTYQAQANEKSAGFGYGLYTGPEISFSFQPESMFTRFNNRLILASSSRNVSETYSETTNSLTQDAKGEYDYNMSILTYLIDWHPTDSAFRISFGVAYNNTEINYVRTGKYTYVVDGITVLRDLTAKADIQFGSSNIAPYLGLGVGTDLQDVKGLKFDMGVGVYYIGPSEVKTLEFSDGITANINQEEAEKDITKDIVEYLPHVHLGFSYKFY